MNERLKELRAYLGITQQVFADKLQIPRNNIAGYETGKRSPSDAVISLICREFHVNEIWLRTGEGEMFKERSPSDEIGYYVEDLLEYEGHGNFFYDMIIEMMKKYHDLDDKSQIVIQEYFKSSAKAALEREKEGD
nr:MAG TPA: helix-turn-helix domain protein [Caudoviricetes sp.]